MNLLNMRFKIGQTRQRIRVAQATEQLRQAAEALEMLDRYAAELLELAEAVEAGAAAGSVAVAASQPEAATPQAKG